MHALLHMLCCSVNVSTCVPIMYVSSTRRSLSADHDGLMRPSSREARSGSSSTYLLSRTKRQTTHELLSAVIGDHIIFSESVSMPGVPIAFRPPEERAKNPERLNLDRLVTCAGKCNNSDTLK